MAVVREFLIATQFLTRLPVPVKTNWTMADLRDSVPMFPIVGIIIGLLASLAYLAAAILNLPAVIAAILAMSAMALLTGGLHEDGLSDVADGFGGGRTREDKLRIMRDSRLGSYGAIVLFLVLTLRISTISTLFEPMMVTIALVSAAALSRSVMPVAMLALPQARPDGLAASADRPEPRRALIGAGLGLLICFLCLPLLTAILVTAACLLAALLFLGLAKHQIGGITGDVLGALQQVVEVVCLLTVVSMTQTY
jgi:adenosylcobinamide-GDP ribazoletransferase